jgi:hypothetical protein
MISSCTDEEELLTIAKVEASVISTIDTFTRRNNATTDNNVFKKNKSTKNVF